MDGKKRSKLNEYLDSGFLPSWLTKGKTPLLQKDKSKCNIASNYRPITYLPLIWKLLLGVIVAQIYGHLHQEKLLPEERKGWERRSRGALLYINRAVIREVRSRKTI